MSPRIELDRINKHFGPMHVINNVNLTVEEREFVVFLGQSGCGKTTTLRAIAGLETIDSGEIRIAGKAVQDTRPEERDIAFVFQSFALYPHLTIYENMAFPLRATRTPRDEVDRTVRRVAEVMNASGASQFALLMSLSNHSPFTTPQDLPDNHLSYAGHWFGLAVVLASIYGLWLRRRLKLAASTPAT